MLISLYLVRKKRVRNKKVKKNLLKSLLFLGKEELEPIKTKTDEHRTRTMRNILLQMIIKNAAQTPEYGYGELNEEMIKEMIEHNDFTEMIENAVQKRQDIILYTILKFFIKAKHPYFSINGK